MDPIISTRRPITSLTHLYLLLTPAQHLVLLKIQSQTGISRRFWGVHQDYSRERGRGEGIDTTLRMEMLSSEQVLESLAMLEVGEGEEPNERWLMILERHRGLREGDVNKLTINERIEFYFSTLLSATTTPNLPVQSRLEPEVVDRVRMWGWLDTESEVAEIRLIKRHGDTWEVGQELMW